MSDAREGGFCVDCGHRVDTFAGLKCCPACGSYGIPCSSRDDVHVSINWHELRILVIWAENYAREHELQTTVYAIARRIEDQHPDRALELPLSLAGELRQMKDQFPKMQIISNDALEQDVDAFKRINDLPGDVAGDG